MIEVKHIKKVFNRGKDDEVIALRDVSLQIPKGEFIVVIGANGSGKTTFLNVLQGNAMPDTGSVLVNGEDITALPDHKRSRWISRVFQNPLHGTAPDLSICDNFRLAALRTGKKTLRIGNDRAFEQKIIGKISELGMGLEKKLDQPMGSLSGGQRQALTLLMGVMADTEILLMDEPTAALDPKSAQVVLQLADRFNRENGLTILLITHNLKDAQHYGNRLLQFSAGSIIRNIAAQEKKALSLPEMYGWFE
jgi:putative ABC transport system ATP-binding protein